MDLLISMMLYCQNMHNYGPARQECTKKALEVYKKDFEHYSWSANDVAFYKFIEKKK